MQYFLTCSICIEVFAESKLAEMDEQLRRMRLQLEDQGHQLQDVNALRARVGQENFELHRHLQELDAGNVQLAKAKSAMQSELDETKARLEDETRVCYFVLHTSDLIDIILIVSTD